MEIETNVLALSIVASFLVGIAVPNLMRYINERNPEVLTRNKLKKFGLPIGDKRFSHIFTHKKDKRIEIANVVLKELQPVFERDNNKIDNAMEDIDEIKRRLNRVQAKIRDMGTEAETEVFSKTHLTPIMADLRLQGEKLGAALSSKIMISNQILFIEQVVQGHDRKKVWDILEGGPFGEIDKEMLVDKAITPLRDALALDQADARAINKKWIQLKD